MSIYGYYVNIAIMCLSFFHSHIHSDIKHNSKSIHTLEILLATFFKTYLITSFYQILCFVCFKYKSIDASRIFLYVIVFCCVKRRVPNSVPTSITLHIKKMMFYSKSRWGLLFCLTVLKAAP